MLTDNHKKKERTKNIAPFSWKKNQKILIKKEQLAGMQLLAQGCESVYEIKSKIIWNVWKDVLFDALKVQKWGFVKSKKVLNQMKNLNSHISASLKGYFAF